jgi:hypothetical protein
LPMMFGVPFLRPPARSESRRRERCTTSWRRSSRAASD